MKYKLSNSKLINKVFFTLILLLLVHQVTANATGHQQHQRKTVTNKGGTCAVVDVRCAKTVTSAFAPNGDLWRVWVFQEQLYYQISADNGQSFAQPQKIAIAKEKISARNENRPKIAFDAHQGVYLSWAKSGAKKYTGDIRFSYSSDYGKSFSSAITVNNDNLPTGHSFNEMQVDASGEVSLVWLDGRLSYQLKQQGKETNGSALYFAKANPRLLKQGDKLLFDNQQLANNTCVCCRIATDVNKNGQLAIFWRHIYGDNIREFALLTHNAAGSNDPQNASLTQPQQISYDHWQINGCPHQGGGITIDENNRYHLVWFNQGDKGKGIFYAYSDHQGQELSTPLAIGELTKQSAHPHVISNNNFVDIVWLQFNGIEHQLWHQQSSDYGKTFAKARLLAVAKNGADRPFLLKKMVNQTAKNSTAEQVFVSWQRPKQGHWLQAL